MGGEVRHLSGHSGMCTLIDWACGLRRPGSRYFGTMPVEDGTGWLGPLEARVMAVVWAADGPVAVRSVLETLNQGRRRKLAYTTVMTVMARLAEKGILRRSPNGRGYDYEATVPDTAAMAVREVLEEFGDTAIARFADAARADPKLRNRLERLLREEP